MSFATKIKIHFDEADPAGIAFAGGLFSKMHHCYEEFIAAAGQEPKQFFLESEKIYPIRHMAADYLKPLFPLQEYQVEISVIRLSEFSFDLQFKVSENGQSHCLVRSTHVCCDKQSMTKSPIPQSLKESLQRFVIPQ